MPDLDRWHMTVHYQGKKKKILERESATMGIPGQGCMLPLRWSNSCTVSIVFLKVSKLLLKMVNSTAEENDFYVRN